MSDNMTLTKITVNGVELAYYEQGSGPLLICLHGFPDTAYTFLAMAEKFAAEGYRVITPFMRGYYPSGLAADGDYALPTLARDILALIDALYEGEGTPRAAIIGHDWGGLAAYHAANLAPEKITALTAMAIPHMASAKTSWQQFKNMWYVLFFQLPKIPEWFIKRNNFGFVDFIYRLWSPSWKTNADNIEAFKEVLRQPGYLEATLGYYRCMLQRTTDESKTLLKQQTTVPALWIAGIQDRSVDIGQLSYIDDSFTRGVELFVVQGAGHFPHLESPDLVQEKIASFLNNTAR
jgi:pimeloyl-ACP methyl ester carboxylesterase